MEEKKPSSSKGKSKEKAASKSKMKRLTPGHALIEASSSSTPSLPRPESEPEGHYEVSRSGTEGAVGQLKKKAVNILTYSPTTSKSDFVCIKTSSSSTMDTGSTDLESKSESQKSDPIKMEVEEEPVPEEEGSSAGPCVEASTEPSAEPSGDPSAGPSSEPSAEPCAGTSAELSAELSAESSAESSAGPSEGPSAEPSAGPFVPQSVLYTPQGSDKESGPEIGGIIRQSFDRIKKKYKKASSPAREYTPVSDAPRGIASKFSDTFTRMTRSASQRSKKTLDKQETSKLLPLTSKRVGEAARGKKKAKEVVSDSDH